MDKMTGKIIKVLDAIGILISTEERGLERVYGEVTFVNWPTYGRIYYCNNRFFIPSCVEEFLLPELEEYEQDEEYEMEFNEI